MLEIAALTILVLLAWGALALGVFLLKALLWLVLLPVRLVAYALIVPLFFLLKFLLGGVLLLVIGPIVALAAVATFVALAAALVVPLLPLAFVAFIIWFVVRLAKAEPSPTRA